MLIRPPHTVASPCYQQGFSLVELLVVLLIIGLGFSLVSVNVGDNNQQQLLIEARQFANRTALLAEEAVLSNQQWGVDLYRQLTDEGDQYGYRWLVRSEQGLWQLANGDNDPVDFVFAPGIVARLELRETGELLDMPAKRDIAEQKSLLEKRQTLSEQLADNNRQAELIRPALWLLSSGEVSPFRLTLADSGNDNEDAQVVITGDELGRIVVDKTGADDE